MEHIQEHTGKYRGKYMMAWQAEYRWQFYKRFGMVAFGGVGGVWGNEDASAGPSSKFLPSAGMGVRYMVSYVKKINLRIDYAFGVDGNQGLYFGIMESF